MAILLYISALINFEIVQQISTFLLLLGKRVCLFKHSLRVVAHLLTSGVLPYEFSSCLRYSFGVSSWSKFQDSFISIFSVSAGYMMRAQPQITEREKCLALSEGW